MSSLIPRSNQQLSTQHPQELNQASAQPSAAPKMPKIDFQEVFNSVVRWCWIPVLTLFLGGLAMHLLIKELPVYYTSHGSLYVKTRAPEVFSGTPVEQEETNDLEKMKTKEQGLLSSTVLLRVADKNDLSSDPLFIEGGLERQSILDTLESRVSVELRKGTRLIDIEVKDTEPARAARIVESIVTEFEGWKDGDQSELVNKMTSALSSQEQQLRAKMKESEGRVLDFRAQNSVVGLDGTQETFQANKLELLTQELATAGNERLVLETQFKAMAANPEGATMPGLVAKSGLSQLSLNLESQIAEKSADFAKIQGRYKSKHPIYIEADNELKRLKQSLTKVMKDAELGLANELAIVRSRESELKEMMSVERASVINEEGVREQFSDLMRAVDVDRKLHSRVELQLQETQLGAALSASYLSWDARPLVPVKSSGTPKIALVLLGCFLGAIGGSVIAVLLTLFDPRVREPSAVERKLRVPMLAKMPSYSRNDAQEISVSGDGMGSVKLPAHLARYTPAPSEDEEKMQTLLFASPFKNDGKTLCVMKCARTMVKQGYRTLVIDADFGSEGLSREYTRQREGRHGLAAYLMGEAEPAEVLFETGLPGLWFLPTGSIKGDSGDLLSGPELRRLLAAIAPMIDRVIIDTSSALETDDVQAIARHIGTSYLVAHKGKGKYRHLKETAEILTASGANLEGFIWNDGCARNRRSDLGPVIEPVTYPSAVREVSARGRDGGIPSPRKQAVRPVA